MCGAGAGTGAPVSYSTPTVAQKEKQLAAQQTGHVFNKY